jgi:hypothetical protein
MNLPPITREAFVASRKEATAPVDSESESFYADMPEFVGAPLFQYAETCYLFEMDGKFWAVAWWYAPVGKDTLAEAEQSAFDWYNEFV